MSALAVLEPGGDAATLLYILSFSLFILGIRGGTHPTSAKRGNLTAAVGMAIAVVTTCCSTGSVTGGSSSAACWSAARWA